MATLVSRWFGGNNSRNGKAWLAYSIPYYWPCLHVPGFIAALASDLKAFYGSPTKQKTAHDSAVGTFDG